jgi:hypothetical membrane protein
VYVAIKLFTKGNAGLIILVGSVQWFMTIIISESFQPDYNSSLHYVSTLGVGTTAFTYNTSIILFGLSLVLSSIILYKTLEAKIFTSLLLITGLLIIGVGVFPENSRPMHGYVTGFAFIFAVLLPIIAFKVLNRPFSYVSTFIGLITLIMLIFFFPYLGLPAESTILILGLAKGTMERLVIYPLLIWMISLSISLFNQN